VHPVAQTQIHHPSPALVSRARNSRQSASATAQASVPTATGTTASVPAVLPVLPVLPGPAADCVASDTTAA